MTRRLAFKETESLEKITLQQETIFPMLLEFESEKDSQQVSSLTETPLEELQNKSSYFPRQFNTRAWPERGPFSGSLAPTSKNFIFLFVK